MFCASRFTLGWIVALAVMSTIPDGAWASSDADEQRIGDALLALQEQAYPRVLQLLEHGQRESDDPTAFAADTRQIRAYALLKTGRLDEALEQAQIGVEEAIQHVGTGSPLHGKAVELLALAHQALGNFATARERIVESLAILENAADVPTSMVLPVRSTLAQLDLQMGDYLSARNHLVQIVADYEASGETHLGSYCSSLQTLAVARRYLAEYALGADALRRSDSCMRSVFGDDSTDRSAYLYELALLEIEQGRHREAESLLTEALSLRTPVLPPDHPEITLVKTSLALVMARLGRYAESERLYQDVAATLAQRDRPADPRSATALNGLGLLYKEMGRRDDAEAVLKQALHIAESAYGPSHPEVAIHLSSLATLYQDTGRLDDAEPLARRSLQLTEAQLGPSHPDTAIELMNLGAIYEQLERWFDAEPLKRRALDIARSVHGGTFASIAPTASLGWLYLRMGRIERGQTLLEDAHFISSQYDRQSLEQPWNLLRLSSAHFLARRPNLSIFFGKLGINGLQRLRVGLSDSQAISQQSFIRSNQDTYEHLVSLLLTQGRIGEAMQVSTMLKEQELFGMIEGDPAVGFDPRSTLVAYTSTERPFVDRLDALAARLRPIRTELDRLELRSPAEASSPDSSGERERLLSAIEKGRRDYQTILADMQRILEADGYPDGDESIASMNSDSIRPLQDKLAGMNRSRSTAESGAADEAEAAPAVFLKYFTNQHATHIVVVEPSSAALVHVPVTRDELDAAIASFRSSLADHRSDVTPSAQRLHQWLIAPIQSHLQRIDPRTLVISTDGRLRYVPFAALHDGSSWLGERHGVIVHADAAGHRSGPSNDRSGELRIAAFGTTQAIGGFSALPSVASELEAIVEKSGIPGQAWLDQDFTPDRFRDVVGRGPAILHIASHFQLVPGSEPDSALLLGDGSLLTLRDIRRIDFNDIALMALSACSTAYGEGRDPDGREIEGFAALAQRRGANAVLASLWNVSDDSTALLMQRFYEAQARGAGTSQALRTAQRALMAGDQPPTGTQGGRQRTQRLSAKPRQAPVATDPQRPYAHPYYWAPFILMGNWL